MTRRRWWRSGALAAASLAAALGLGGCLGLGSDPWAGQAGDPCAPGNLRPTGEACVVTDAATIVVDGVADDWAGVAVVSLSPTCLAPPCTDAAPAELQLARDAQRLYLRVRLAGGAAPVTDPARFYQVRFAGTSAWPSREVDALWGGAGGTHFTKSGYFVDPPDGVAPVWAFTLTADGFEASVPIYYLPFVSGTTLDLAVIDAPGGVATTVLEAASATRACWQPGDYTNDPCAEWR